MVKVTNQDNNSSLILTMTSILTPDFTKNANSFIRNLFNGIAEVLKINIQQINEKYNDTFILFSEGEALDTAIKDLSNINRKNGESDADYRNRYYKYTFQYNGTKEQFSEAIHDITGEYPIQLLANNTRNFFWGEGDLDVEDQYLETSSYYNDSFENAAFWGDSNIDSINGFTGYIYLSARPDETTLSELIEVIRLIKGVGTKIYLVFNDATICPIVDAPEILANTDYIYGGTTVSWTPNFDAGSYIFTLFNNSSPPAPVSGYDELEVYDNTLTIEGLIEGGSFNYEVYGLIGECQTEVGESSTFSIDAIPFPESITTDDVTSDSITISWDFPTDITEVNIYYSDDDFATSTKISDLTSSPYTITGLTPETEYKYAMTSNFDTYESIDSATTTETTLSGAFDFITDSNTLLYWRGQEGSGTSINDSTANNKDGSLAGTTTSCWQSGFLTGDTASIKLNGTNNKINTATSDNTAFVDFTLRTAIRFGTGELASREFHALINKSETSIGGSNSETSFQSYIRYGNKLRFVVWDTTHTASQKGVLASCDYTFLENTNYIIQIAFKLQNPLNSNLNLFEMCINGVKQTVTLTSLGLSNVTAVKHVNSIIVSGSFFSNAYLAKLRYIRPAVIDTAFRTEAQALTDYNNMLTFV